MGALTAARAVILPEERTRTFHDIGTSSRTLGKRLAANAEKSIGRIENDDCTWLGVSG
jgi:hypothetical protein